MMNYPESNLSPADGANGLVGRRDRPLHRTVGRFAGIKRAYATHHARCVFAVGRSHWRMRPFAPRQAGKTRQDRISRVA